MPFFVLSRYTEAQSCRWRAKTNSDPTKSLLSWAWARCIAHMKRIFRVMSPSRFCPRRQRKTVWVVSSARAKS